MSDIVSPAVRSRMMAGISGKNTKPEMIVRRGLHAMGFRFRLHDEALPGKPDLVLPKYRTAIFVHGCFWHGHEGCPNFKWPKTRAEFWRNKITGNSERDSRQIAAIEAADWRVIVIWECQMRGQSMESITKLLLDVAETLRGEPVTTGPIKQGVPEYA